MPYFSRLTDIVTCSLSDLLAEADDPGRALAEIIAEMEQGSAGAARAVATAAGTVTRLEGELTARRGEIDRWDKSAKEELKAGREEQAKAALIRRREARDMVAALEQELDAARGTHSHLQTTARALDARLSDARRKRATLEAGGDVDAVEPVLPDEPVGGAGRSSVDDELEALRKELAGG